MYALLKRSIRNFMVISGLGLLAACSTPEPSGAAPFAALVMDARTGEVLYEDNADARLHPASLTKMMTLYIAFEALERGEISIDTVVTASKHAASEPPSRLGLKPGQKIAMRYLIRAAAIKSANDAATAIGETIGGSEAKFAARMNRTAKALGMTNTTFKNANGLTTSGHLTTARDMTILGRRLFYDFPQYYNIFSRRSTDAGIATVASTNRRFLDSYEGADGIKTGFTNAAGFNLTASAQRNGVRIIATVLGGTSTAQRNAKMAELLDLGFKRARKGVPEAPPPAPSYEPAPDESLMVEVEGTGQAVNPGKTIRLQTAVASSARPKARPSALGRADPVPFQVAQADPAPTQDAAAAAVDSMQDNIADALAEAVELEQPAEVQVAAAEAPPVAAPVETAADITPVERPKAETLVAAATEVIAEPVQAPAQEPVEMAMAEPKAAAEPLPFSLVDPETLNEMVPVSSAGAIVTPMPEPVAETASPVIHTVTPKPAQDEGEAVIVAEAEAGTSAEVVTRISTSGGRHWGVNLGRFDSHDTAERMLMKTMLSESTTLGGGLRKIVQKGGGYDANFMGLTQEQADLACRRLQARGTQCFTIGQ